MKHSEHKVGKVFEAKGEKHPDVEVASGQTMRSLALSHKKKMLDMADGDEHFVSNLSVGPINDMYLAIRAYSMFPHGAGLVSLIHDTKANSLD
jgi:hypothetical protein